MRRRPLPSREPGRTSSTLAGPAARRVRALVALVIAAAASALAACAPAPPPEPADPVPQSALAPSLGVDLSAMERTPTGLYVQTLREGMGARVRSGQQVRVHYEGWFANGRKFDSSRDRGESISFPVGRSIVIDAWDEGITGMRIGEVRRLVVPPELGYGDEGVPGAIPPAATLVFEIELLGIE